jgi:8-oxo-dGTP pyrophosphatase MutT (NUDIX family)
MTPPRLRYLGAVYRLALPHADEGIVGERWGSQGSGLLLTTGSKILLLHRSPHVKEPGTWGIPGGAVPIDTETGQPKDVLQSALHEAEEEMSSVPPHRIIDQYVYRESSGFRYTTFIGAVAPDIDKRWAPQFNWEHDQHGWFIESDLRDLNLHFGVVEVLKHKRGILFPKQQRAHRAAAALQVVDFRDPNYKPELNSYWGPKWAAVAAHIAVGRTKIFLYNYAEGNTLDWREMLDVIYSDGAFVASNQAVLTKTGNLLMDAGHTWGSKSRFSSNLAGYIRPIYEAGLVKGNAEVWLGNTASLRGRKLGTVDEFLEKRNIQLPDQLVLYHGTSDVAAEEILREGLKAQPVHRRVWHKDVLSKHPDWRGSAVYLTVDLYQAHYYATKAVNVLRRRGYRGVKPVVLKVLVPKAYFNNFLPDDDYLTKLYGKSPRNPRQLDLFHDLSWLGSLGEMSQVAYLGSIPPAWLSVESRLSKQQYEDPQVASVRYLGARYLLVE